MNESDEVCAVRVRMKCVTRCTDVAMRGIQVGAITGRKQYLAHQAQYLETRSRDLLQVLLLQVLLFLLILGTNSAQNSASCRKDELQFINFFFDTSSQMLHYNKGILGPFVCVCWMRPPLS